MIIDIIKKDITPSHIEDIAINILASMEEYKTQIMPVVNGENKFLGIVIFINGKIIFILCFIVWPKPEIASRK